MADESAPEGASGPNERKTLLIEKADARRVQAILAHLRQACLTVSTEKGILRPLSIDQDSLLLASASLRALFFDGGGMLTSFLEEHEADLQIEALETDIGLVLLSELVPDDIHLSDYLLEALLKPKSDEEKKFDQPWDMLLAYEDRSKFRGLLARPHLWAPSKGDELNGPSPASNGGPVQLATLCRRRVGVREWGRLRLGYLKTVPIDRRSIVGYVANQLGGVHYDSKRLPKDPDDAAQFHALAAGLDWDHEAITPAGLVAVALLCIELANSPDVIRLGAALSLFVAERQERLRAKSVI